MIATPGAAVAVIPPSQRASLSVRRRNRTRIGLAHGSSFNPYSAQEELNCSFDGAKGTEFAGNRDATQRLAREESSKPGTSHDQGEHLWQDQTRDGKRCDMRQAGSMFLGNAHPPYQDPKLDHGAYVRDFFPLQNLPGSSLKEHQHHGFSAKMHRRVPLPSKHRQSRMHNNFSVFEGVVQPSLGLSTRKNAGELSHHGIAVNMAPSNSNRQVMDLQKGSIKENVNRGVRFSPKFQKAIPNRMKEDNGSIEVDASKEERLGDSTAFVYAGQGFRSASKDGKKAEDTRVNEPWKYKSRRKEIYVKRNDGKAAQIDHREARSLPKERVDHAEADRERASTFEPHIPIRRETASNLAQRSFTSIGSRSSPSRTSVQFRNCCHSRLDSHGAIVVNPSKLLTEYEPKHSLSEHKEAIELDATQNILHEGPSEAGVLVESLDVEWTESDSEGDEDDALSINAIAGKNATKGNVTEEDVYPSFGSSASPREDIFNWSHFDWKTVNGPEFDSTERLHHHKDHRLSPIDSVAEDMGTPQRDYSCRFTYDKEHILSTAMCSPVDMTSGASGMGDCSNPTDATASWHKHDLPGLPFEFQFSYSENPKAPILGYREIPYSPFGPSNMGRPWTGGPPHNPSKKKQHVFDSFNPPPKDKKGVKYVQDPGPYPEGQGPQPGKSREEIMGASLTKDEIVYLVQKCERESRQVNLGRDGLTHNMLAMIHDHWKRRRVCKIKCKGVPTMDMDNVKFHIEDKTGGKIIYQAGGVLYLFRGRNYNYKDRPPIPLMLWKPVAPIYPKLVKPAPGGLTAEKAQKLREMGQKVQPICRLGKNGVYMNLVKDVQAAFAVDELVCIDCGDLYPRDYRKIGAKLKDLVPCVLLSFEDGRILIWKGKQDPLVERSSRPDLEPQLANAEASKHSSTNDVQDSDSTPEKELTIAAAGTSDLAHVRDGEAGEKRDLPHASEAEIEESLYQLCSEQESACDAMASSALQMTKEQVQWRCNRSSSDKTLISSPSEGPAPQNASERRETYSTAHSGLLPKETNNQTSAQKGLTYMHEVIHGKNPSSTSGEIDSDASISASKMFDTADRRFQNETESEGADITLEEMNRALMSEEGKDGQNKVMPSEKALSGSFSSHAVRDGFGSASRDEPIRRFESEADMIVRIDALWDDALSSGRAVEVAESDMDDDMILSKVAEIDRLAPSGPKYTLKLIYKLRLRRDVDRENDVLHINFGKVPSKAHKKVVKKNSDLPAWDVPGMGGLPVDGLVKLLALKQSSI